MKSLSFSIKTGSLKVSLKNSTAKYSIIKCHLLCSTEANKALDHKLKTSHLSSFSRDTLGVFLVLYSNDCQKKVLFSIFTKPLFFPSLNPTFYKKLRFVTEKYCTTQYFWVTNLSFFLGVDNVFGS